jgi:16S rRNA (cytosine1402-N4)-methyltransferase
VSARHEPVLLAEAVEAARAGTGDIAVDATFGAGGYARALLERGATVHAFDRDPDAISEGRALEAEFAPRLTLHQARFSQMEDVLQVSGIPAVRAVVMDLGVSSMQFDRAERGFAFSLDGPLDMRMEKAGPGAAEFVNEAEADELANVIYELGEERQSRRIARAIVTARPLRTTGELAAAVRAAVGGHPQGRKDAATRTFQAIRIHVNGELDELRAGLAAAERLLEEGGRLVVVSFHSLEDRMVKRFLKDRSDSPRGSRHLPEANATAPAAFAEVSKAIRPSRAEVARNPRARSAVLRHATRTGAPARKEAA